MKKFKQGFTLVEIMIVVAIIGLLAAIAIPNFMKSRETSRKNACINNLRQIDGAKEQLAIEKNLGEGATASEDDVKEYIKGGKIPTCPAGAAAYTIGSIGVLPTCAYDKEGYEHVLPEAATTPTTP
jgi:prepilin-type N-terminal cleavage/methylation domain-containing protein